MELSDMEILQYAVSNGMIDTESLQKSIEMKKKEEYLKKHQYAINKGKDGYWRTYLPDEEKGRRLVKKKSEEDLKKKLLSFTTKKSKIQQLQKCFTNVKTGDCLLKRYVKQHTTETRDIFSDTMESWESEE